MSRVALVDDMGVDDVGFLIENLGADAAPLQYLRELVQNELEAIQRAGVEYGEIEIDYEEIAGVRKLRISGNGEGMTPDDVADNLNRLSASGGIQAFDKNFGIGAKITAGTRNPHGVVYKAWKNGSGSLTTLGRLDGRYGRLGIRNEDGTVDYWLPLPEEDKHPSIDQHGVSVVLLGRNAEDDTSSSPPGVDLPSQWIAAYLERRYFQIPANVSVRVLRPVEIYDAEQGTHRAIYDTIRGQRYYLDRHSEARGHHVVEELKATVWWWLLNEEITKGGKTWNNRGHVAALYQDELYEVRGGQSRWSALKDFGIYAGFGRIVIYVEPHNVLKANTPRTALILKGNQPIDYAEIGAAFVEKMPDELAGFMAGQVSAERGDHRKAIKKSLKEIAEALQQARYRRSRRGKPDHFDIEEGRILASTGEPEPAGRNQDRAPRPQDAADRIGGEYLRRAREERERRMRGEKVESDPSPKIVWDEEGTTVPTGRAATYNPRVHVVTANSKYEGYLDMVEWAADEAKNRAASEMDDESLKTIAEDEVRRWFEQAWTEAVVALRPMAHDAKWGPKVYETGLSDEGLTAAIVSHIWHMMSAIKRGLAGRLGRQKDAA
jgi:hypothetical protein